MTYEEACRIHNDLYLLNLKDKPKEAELFYKASSATVIGSGARYNFQLAAARFTDEFEATVVCDGHKCKVGFSEEHIDPDHLYLRDMDGNTLTVLSCWTFMEFARHGAITRAA